MADEDEKQVMVSSERMTMIAYARDIIVAFLHRDISRQLTTREENAYLALLQFVTKEYNIGFRDSYAPVYAGQEPEDEDDVEVVLDGSC